VFGSVDSASGALVAVLPKENVAATEEGAFASLVSAPLATGAPGSFFKLLLLVKEKEGAAEDSDVVTAALVVLKNEKVGAVVADGASVLFWAGPPNEKVGAAALDGASVVAAHFSVAPSETVEEGGPVLLGVVRPKNTVDTAAVELPETPKVTVVGAAVVTAGAALPFVAAGVTPKEKL
jgi:hypothetical protein